MRPTSVRHVLASAVRPIVFGGWAVGVSVPVAYLMASHWVPLPAAGTPTTVPAAVVPTADRRWRATHVLSTGCPCSAAVADYLARRGPAADLDEAVLVCGTGPFPAEAELAGRGFHVTRVTADELRDRYGVRGAPWLLVADPADSRVAYSGGYAADRPRAGTALFDLDVVRRVRAGEHVDPFPAFGCATDAGLRRAIDPLGLKYR